MKRATAVAIALGSGVLIALALRAAAGAADGPPRADDFAPRQPVPLAIARRAEIGAILDAYGVPRAPAGDPR